MPWTSEHTKWLADTGQRLKTADGKDVEVWEFQHQDDQPTLSAWAKHFRNHYCLDDDIDSLKNRQSRKDYLNNIKFPSRKSRLGRSIRAGDFGEILVADYLQWILGFWVPRVRWSSKFRDESPKGCDVLGFRFQKKKGTSDKDVLAVFESKTKFSKSKKNKLQDAINHSAKDHLRLDESLNFVRQKLREKNQDVEAELVGRFQSPVDVPYEESFGAAAIMTDEYFDATAIAQCDCGKIPSSGKLGKSTPHPNGDKLLLMVITGPDMMTLVHELYRRAADEA